MGRKPCDLTGQRFGRLTVLGASDKRLCGGVLHICQCDCGNVKLVLKGVLDNGTTVSCGCYVREKARETAIKHKPRLLHGMAGSLTYVSYHRMMERCFRPDERMKHYYGDKGITVCDRWADPVDGFLNFVEDMGKRPSPKHTLDRIDGSKGYYKENCRWATRSEQMQNTSKKSKHSGYRGVAQNRKKWSSVIAKEGTIYRLGTYETKEEAALAYNTAADILYGENGTRNKLPLLEDEIVDRIVQSVNNILLQRKTIT